MDGQTATSAWYGLVVTAVLPVVAAGFAWLGKWAEKRRGEARQDRDLLVADLRGQLTDHKSEISLLREQNNQIRALNERYRDDYAGCREDLASLWGSYALLYDAAARHVAAIRRLGGDVEDLPPSAVPPLRPPRHPETEFMRREAAQGQTLLDEIHDRKRGGAGNAGTAG